MKKLLSALLMVFTLGVLNTLEAQESTVPSIDPNAPEIKFESEVIDYGAIEYEANGIREFKFKNTGKTPLTITAVTGECGCTATTIDGKPGWPQEPILPGKSGVIKVKYDTKREGRFDKNVTVTSNAKFPSMKVKIKGEVKAKAVAAGGQ
jgi:hypothetical protein